MIIIGSAAYPAILSTRSASNVLPDLDIMMTQDEYSTWVDMESRFNPNMKVQTQNENYSHVTNTAGYENIEIYIGHSGNSTERLLGYCNNQPGIIQNASLDVLYAIKQSHKYKRNSPHFLKTMRDIQYFEREGATLSCPVLKSIVAQREIETYDYSHPVLQQGKDTFFSDEMGYVYDHDTIHKAIACSGVPAYKSYMQDGEDVMTDKQKFFACSEKTRLWGVYEEACVLALERSQIPFNFEISPKSSFITALIKVCTSITSGWFREYAYDNFDKIISMYRLYGEDDYIKLFKENSHKLKAYGWDKK